MRLSRFVAFSTLLLVGCTRQPAPATGPGAVVLAAPTDAGKTADGSVVAEPAPEATAGADAGISAVTVPSADVAVNAGAAGAAGGLALLRGGPLKPERWEVTLRRVRSDWTEISERVAFAAGHAAATLAVPDRLEFGVDRVATYSPSQWGIRSLEVSVDDKPVALQRSEQPVDEFEGAFIFEFPADARRVEVRYWIESVAPSDHSRAWSWDGRTLRSFGAPPEIFTLRWDDIGDLPATQLALTFGDSAQPWKFEQGSLYICLAGAYPTLVGIEVPAGPCGFPLCGADTTDAVTCMEPTQNFACAGVLSQDHGLERWMTTAAAGCYDERSLTLARNWPYARRGHPFQNALLRDYFAAQPWYRQADKPPPKSALEAKETKAVEFLKRLHSSRSTNRACAVSRCGQVDR